MFPEKLKTGDEIRVIAPSRSLSIVSQDIVSLACKRLKSLGLNVTFGKYVYSSTSIYQSGLIEERLFDIHDAFSSQCVKGILTVVGGYNSNQLLPYLDYDLIARNPKCLCGLSDITAIQNAIYTKTGLVSFYGPHFSNFGMKLGFDYTLNHFKRMLFDKNCTCLFEPSHDYSSDVWYLKQDTRCFRRNHGLISINEGRAEGIIVGGNLCTLNLLQGTEYFPDIKGKILFLEDTTNLNSNYFLEFDRNLESLMQCSGFEEVRGLVIGRAEDRSGMTIDLWKYLFDKKKKLKHIPIIVNADFGHTTPMTTFPIGGRCKIQSKATGCRIVFFEI